MNWKNLKEKQTWPKRIIIPQFTWKDWGEPREFSTKIASISVGIQTKHLRNTSDNPYRGPVRTGAHIYIYIYIYIHIYIHIYTHTHTHIYIWGARSRWRLLLGRWRSIFGGLHYGTQVVLTFPVHSEVAPGFLEYLCILYIYILVVNQ